MLSLEQKQNIFFEYLNNKNGSYSDVIREEIKYYFDDLGNSLDFLNKFISRDEINKFIDLLVSKIIINEHHDGIHNIIEYYCY